MVIDSKMNNTEIILITKVLMTTSQSNSLISLAILNKCVTLCQFEVVGFKVNKTRNIALFVINGSVKKLFLIDCVNICLFTIFFSIDFAWWKSVGHPTLLVS